MRELEQLQKDKQKLVEALGAVMMAFYEKYPDVHIDVNIDWVTAGSHGYRRYKIPHVEVKVTV